jgi:hypothetical protein
MESRLHGKDCSYNPLAFPPSLEVRCRRYDHKEVGGRVAPGAATENNVRNTTPGKEEVE